MSLLGQMIFKDGMETGMKRGMRQGMEKSMVKIVNKTVEEIHENTDIPVEKILKIKETLDGQSS